MRQEVESSEFQQRSLVSSHVPGAWNVLFVYIEHGEAIRQTVHEGRTGMRDVSVFAER